MKDEGGGGGGAEFISRVNVHLRQVNNDIIVPARGERKRRSG